jgi:hypothetical protein
LGAGQDEEEQGTGVAIWEEDEMEGMEEEYTDVDSDGDGEDGEDDNDDASSDEGRTSQRKQAGGSRAQIASFSSNSNGYTRKHVRLTDFITHGTGQATKG